MSEDAEVKSADQILDEIFNTLVTRTHSSTSETEVSAIVQHSPHSPSSNLNIIYNEDGFLLRFIQI